MPHLMLIDGSNAAKRAHYVSGPDSLEEKVLSMLRRLVREWEPTHLIFVCDPEGPCFRHEEYPDYKGTRDPDAPSGSELCAQVVPHLEAHGIAHFTPRGFEADDAIHTLAIRAAAKGSTVSVVSRDTDFLQLAAHGVRVLRPVMGNEESPDGRGAYVADSEWLLGRYGIEPHQVCCFKVMVGEGADNIPGLQGIGEKTAASLLRRFGSLEGIYEGLATLSAKKGRVLAEGRDQVFRFRTLIRLREDVPLEGLDPRLTTVPPQWRSSPRHR